MALNDEEIDDQLGSCNKSNITIVNYLWCIFIELYYCTINHVDYKFITEIVSNMHKVNNCFNNYLPLKMINSNFDTKYSCQTVTASRNNSTHVELLKKAQTLHTEIVAQIMKNTALATKYVNRKYGA